MKGIILAGGNGTRLYPLTLAVSKQILPIYDKPMIYYPLATLMLAQIKDILIISTERDLGLFQNLLGDGYRFGINLSYAVQKNPNGLAEAFKIGQDFIGQSSVSLILGDNLFFGPNLEFSLKKARQIKEGATIFAYEVQDPQRYGVVNFEKHTKKIISLEEKPKNPLSSWAITGLYFYDNDVVSMAKTLKPSKRGELEITDINNLYLQNNKLEVLKFGRGFAWFDMGTPNSLHDASAFVKTIEARQAIKIMCPEEIALQLGYLKSNELWSYIENDDNDYNNYLKKCIHGLEDD